MWDSPSPPLPPKLSEALTPLERTAVSIVCRAVSQCGLPNQSGTDPAATSTKEDYLFPWRAVAANHLNLETVCHCLTPEASPSDTLNWVRVLCFCLDLYRLRLAAEATKSNRPSDLPHASSEAADIRIGASSEAKSDSSPLFEGVRKRRRSVSDRERGQDDYHQGQGIAAHVVDTPVTSEKATAGDLSDDEEILPTVLQGHRRSKWNRGRLIVGEDGDSQLESAEDRLEVLHGNAASQFSIQNGTSAAEISDGGPSNASCSKELAVMLCDIINQGGGPKLVEIVTQFLPLIISVGESLTSLDMASISSICAEAICGLALTTQANSKDRILRLLSSNERSSLKCLQCVQLLDSRLDASGKVGTEKEPLEKLVGRIAAYDGLKASTSTKRQNLVPRPLKDISVPPSNSEALAKGLGSSLDSAALIIVLPDTVEVVRRVFLEYWRRIEGLCNSINSVCEATDAKGLVLTMMGQYGGAASASAAAGAVEVLDAVRECQRVLTSDCIPIELRPSAQDALLRIRRISEKWLNTHKENEERRKMAEDAEKAKRQLEQEEVDKREEKRLAAVRYVQDMAKRENEAYSSYRRPAGAEQSRLTNPFWIVGIPPLLADDALITRVKRRLSLLLHPDKCAIPAKKVEAQEVFKTATLAISQCQQLLKEGNHIHLPAPPERAPFSESCGIPNFVPASGAHLFPSKNRRFTFNTRSATSGDGGSKATSAPSPPSSPATQPSTPSEVRIWHPKDIAKLGSSELQSLFPRSRLQSLDPPEVAIIKVLQNSVELSVRCKIPVGCKVHLYVFRPIVIADPTIKCAVIKTPPSRLSSIFRSASESAAGNEDLRIVNAVVALNSTSFIGTLNSIITPNLYPPTKDEVVVFIAAQALSLEEVPKIASPISWAYFWPKALTTRTASKLRLIEWIQLFDHSPEEYGLQEVFVRNRDVLSASGTLDFSSRMLTGLAKEGLRSLLEELVAQAMAAEQGRAL